MKKVLFFAMAVEAAMMLGAATYNASTGYVTQNLFGSAGGDSPFNWTKVYDSKGTAFWSDGLALHANTNYYSYWGGRTPYGKAIVNDDGTFVTNMVLPANKIVVSGKGTISLKTYDPFIITFANEGLVCLGGSCIQVNDGSLAPFLVDGLITLEGTSSAAPLKLRPCNVSNAEQTACFLARIQTTASTDWIQIPWETGKFGNIQFLGDMTAFDGVVNVASNRVVLGNTGLPCAHARIKLENQSELALLATNEAEVALTELDVLSQSRVVVPATNVLHVAVLKATDAGTRLSFGFDGRTNGCLVADAVTFPTSGTVEIALAAPAVEAFTNTPTALTILKAPEGTLDLSRFTAVSGTRVGTIPTIVLSVETVDGQDRLMATWNPVVEQIVSIPSAGYAGLFNQTSTWSNARTPVENTGFDFYSPSTLSIYLPSYGTPWTFPGRSFVKDGGSITFQASHPETYSNIFIKAGTLMRCWPGGTNTIIAPLTFYGDSVQTKFVIGNRTYWKWQGPISGQTQLRLAIRAYASDVNDWRPCYFELTGTNSEFKGTWRLEPESYKIGTAATPAFTSFENYYQGLVISDSANLGCPLDAFTYDALTIWDWQALVVRADETEDAPGTVTLDDTTRGVNAYGTAQFIVETNRTLAVKVPLTIEGTIKKRGAGTLALGGATSPHYCQAKQLTAAGLVTAGLSDTNVLWIAEGGLKPLSKEATDGLSIKVGPAGALRLDLIPTGDVATYGLYNTAWTTPLVAVDSAGVADAAAQINVAFDLPADGIESKRYRVPVCTVSAAAAPSLRGRFAFARPAENYDVSLSEESDTAAGTVTFVASVAPSGFMVLVR